MSSCSHARTLEFQLASLARRVDGLEAAIGEIRGKLARLEQKAFYRGRFECTCGWSEPIYLDFGEPPVSRKCPVCQGVAVSLRGGNA